MDVKALKSMLREDPAKWYFGLSGKTDTQLMATGVFTGDQRHAFYSKRSISSFRGKLFSLRNQFTPGRRLDTVSVMMTGQNTPVVLRIDDLEKDFKEKMVFVRKSVYYVCLSSERISDETDMEIE